MTILALVLLLVLGATGVVSADKLKDLFTPSNTKQKAQVVVLTADVNSANAALAKAQAAQASADANQKAIDAAAKAKQESQHQLVRGTGLALQKEKDPSIYVQVAAVLNSDADQSFDVLPSDKTTQIVALVDELTSADKAKVAEANEQLSAIQGQLASEQAKERSLEAQQVVLTQARDSNAALASSLQTKTADDAKSMAKWAADNQTLLQKVKAFVLWTSIFGGL